MQKKWRRQRRAVVAGQEEEGEGRIEPKGLFIYRHALLFFENIN
jgi:hypothetical protein